MDWMFVESRDFADSRTRFLEDDKYRELQNELLVDPERGDVMPGCGGLRKLRTADKRRSKGKRGGARIIYLQIPQVRRIDLLLIYGKDEQDDLAPDQKKQLKKLADQMRAEAVRAAGRKGTK